jgi:hypothetical protein
MKRGTTFAGPPRSCRPEQRVAECEWVEDVRVENDLERRNEHPGRALLQLRVATDLFAHLGQRVEGRLALCVPLLLEREDVFDPNAPMLSRLRTAVAAEPSTSDWWAEAMDQAASTDFEDRHVDLPRCGGKDSLEALRYEWPVGFARFVVDACLPATVDCFDVRCAWDGDSARVPSAASPLAP